MSLTVIDLSLILVGLFCVYKYLTRNHEVFKKRGIKYSEPIFFFGNMLGLITGRDDGWTIFQNLFIKFRNEK